MTYFLGEYMGSALGGVKDMVWSKLPSLFNRAAAQPPKQGIFSDNERYY